METLTFIALMVVGTFALGYNDIQRKRCLNDGMPEQALLSLTMFGGGFLLLVPLIVLGFPELLPGFWPAVWGTIALNVISQNVFIRAFKLADASVIAPIRLIIPPLVVVTGFLFLGEKPSLLGIVGIFITMAGLWYLLFPENPFSIAEISKLKTERGILLGLLGSVLFAVSFPLDKKAVITSSSLFASSFIFMNIGVITYLLNAVLRPGFVSESRTFFRKDFKALLSVSLFLGFGVFLTNQAFNYSLAAYASSLKRLQALWTIVLSGKFLGEAGLERKLVATAVMFGGIIFSVLFK